MLILKTNLIISKEERERLYKEAVEQFNSGGVLVLDGRMRYEVVEIDEIGECVVNPRAEDLDSR